MTFWVFSVIAVVLCAVLLWQLALSPGPVDLAVYRAAGAAVIDGHPYLYAPDFGQQTGTLLRFTYPPIAAVLSTPLTLLPLTADYVVWTLVGAWLLVTYVSRHSRDLDVVRVAGLAFTSSICLWTLPVTDTLALGQLGIFLTLACVAGCSSRHAAPAMLIGLFAAVKLTPLLFLVYFAVTGQWRRLAWATGAFAGLTLVGFLLMPTESTWFFTNLGNSADRVGDPAFYSNQSIAGALRRFGVDNQVAWALLACIVVAAGLWLARKWYLKGSLVGGAVVVGLTSVLVSPVSWQHHAVWIIPAVILAYSYAEPTWEKIVIGLLFGVSLLRLPLWMSWWDTNQWLSPIGDSLTLAVVGLLTALWLLVRRISERAPGTSDRLAPAT
ncbi:MAG: glycosyltransferase 87 family protein [Candidatus Nanopelagicales bacterium]|nr:glycosyltransferase 87 family protein [Candidatus Nanopelagicales bacterium]